MNLYGKLSTSDDRAVPYKWTAERVAEHFKEAAATLRRLPPVHAQGYWNSWPEIKYTPNELMFQEVIRRKSPPTAGEISRLYQTFEWMPWISVEERKLIWQRAKKVLWKTIAYDLGCNRSTAWERWMVALNKISMHLNRCGQCRAK